MKSRILLTCIVAALLITGCNRNKATADQLTPTPKPQSGFSQQLTEPLSPTPEPTYDYQAALDDVIGGSAVGTAKAGFANSRYYLIADFDNLPGIDASQEFYEGWVVRQNPLSIISTGKVVFVNGRWSNSFSTDQDLTDHTRYVLTLEPRYDGPRRRSADPAPTDDHIVEGIFVRIVE